MGTHGDLAHPRIGRQCHRDRRGQCLGACVLIDEVAYRAQVCGVFGERGLDGTLQSLSAVAIEQLQQASGERPEVRAAAAGAQE